jgi:pimeloyl-ACP methyl ester carboxylesterase
MHSVIARRWLGRLGPMGRSVERPYTAVTRFVYGSVRSGTAVVGAGLDRLMSVEAATLDGVRSWTNGFFGDGLGRHQQRLGTSMTVRVDPGSQTSGRLVLLVHGLGKTESCWYGAGSAPGLARLLAEHPELTPVLVRYNTGLSVADNGILLADLIDDLVSEWPLPVESIALVGHSMGGLVVDAAFGAVRRSERRWVDRLTDIITIGTPYHGAPLEKFVRATARGLAAFRTTSPLAEFLDGRSVGIKDLGGVLADHEVPPAGVRYHLIAGVVTADPAHPLGRIVGDLMVRVPSSTRRRGAEPTSTAIVGGVTHFDLLDAPVVIDQVMEWLAPPA